MLEVNRKTIAKKEPAFLGFCFKCDFHLEVTIENRECDVRDRRLEPPFPEGLRTPHPWINNYGRVKNVLPISGLLPLKWIAHFFCRASKFRYTNLGTILACILRLGLWRRNLTLLCPLANSYLSQDQRLDDENHVPYILRYLKIEVWTLRDG